MATAEPHTGLATSRASQALLAGPLIHWLPSALLVLLVVALYHPAFQFGFWYDDPVPNLSTIESHTALELVLPVQSFGYYRPVTMLTLWALVRAFGGYNALFCHGLSIFLHVANALLLVRVLQRYSFSPLLAWIAGLALAVIPVAPQAVAYFAGIFHPLVLFWLLLALLAQRRAAADHATAPVVASTVLLALAAGTHELGVAIAPLVIISPWVLEADSLELALTRQRGHPSRHRIPWTSLCLPMAGPLLYLAILALAPGEAGESLLQPGVLERMRILSQPILYPLLLVARPLTTNPLPIALATLPGLAVAAILLRRRQNLRLGLWALAWFALAVLPSVLLLEVDYVAHGPRLGYVAGAGAAVGWAATIEALWHRARRGPLASRALCVLGAGSLGAALLLLPLPAVRQHVALLGHTSRLVTRMADVAQESPPDQPLFWVNLPYYWTPADVYGSSWRPYLPWYRWAEIVIPDYSSAQAVAHANGADNQPMHQVRFPGYNPTWVTTGEEVSATRLRSLAEQARVFVLDLPSASYYDLSAAWTAAKAGADALTGPSFVAPLLAPPEYPTESELATKRPLDCRSAVGLTLTGILPSPMELVPGENTELLLFWQLDASSNNIEPVLDIVVRDRTGARLFEATRPLVHGLPLYLWRQEQAYVTRLPITIPPGAITGDGSLEVILHDTQGARLALEGCGLATGTAAVQLPVLLGASSLASSQDLASMQTREVTFDDHLRLLGHAALSTSASAGDVLPLTLYWRTEATPDCDYTVFRQVLDASGAVVAQLDSQPNSGLYPTSTWSSGVVVRDTARLELPALLPAGEYRVVVGLYDPSTLERLRVLDPSSPDNAVEIAAFTVRD